MLMDVNNIQDSTLNRLRFNPVIKLSGKTVDRFLETCPAYLTVNQAEVKMFMSSLMIRRKVVCNP